MSNIIIGTAGHIDHGKTSLIKALTGRDTDRLKEEKDRGITIDLGFSYFDLPNGQKAGIIDVPGHEKFLNNMLSGVYGMDLILFVVAGDEGVMPQTIEHLNILNLIGVKNGIIVITKSDLIDEEMQELVIEDIKEHFIGTFLEQAEIHFVSSKTGFGMDSLTHKIALMCEAIRPKDEKTSSRLYIDRVFTLKGIGVVVTGTLTEGRINLNDELTVYPHKHTVRVRNIQVHGNNVEHVIAGQRAAINIVGAPKQLAERGNVIAAKDSLALSNVIDVELFNLKDSERTIKNGSRLHFFTGTIEQLSKVNFLDRKELSPGENCIAQLKFEDEIAVKYGDKFIVRFFSPLETLGGGRITDPQSILKRPKNKKACQYSFEKASANLSHVIYQFIEERSEGIEIRELFRMFSIEQKKLEELLKGIVLDHKIIECSDASKKYYFARCHYLSAKEAIVQELELFHKTNNLKLGLNKETLMSNLGFTNHSFIFNKILDLMKEESIIINEKEFLSINGFIPTLNSKQHLIYQECLNLFEIDDRMVKKDDLSGVNPAGDVVDYLLYTGELELIGNEFYILRKDLQRFSNKIINYIREKNTISASEVRDLLKTNRRKAVLILEYLDMHKITKRVDDFRILF
ncbi:MAG: selenocysteine-specific translation elongation factor [Tissierellales bacterium]|nr:selenocysteine-specific translation elongation factor [Tissierellales bacterium]MBN2826999.1 selenocysteine-specific translation elongation factor [Tissierellales bacterium]